MHPRLHEESFGLQLVVTNRDDDDTTSNDACDPMQALIRREEALRDDAIWSIRDRKLKAAIQLLGIKVRD